MSRHAHAFQCTECLWWNYPMLREDMDGNYVIKCGHCAHHHYRVIKQGRVIDDGTRHGKREHECEIIHVMPSACSERKRVLGSVAEFRALAATPLIHSTEEAP